MGKAGFGVCVGEGREYIRHKNKLLIFMQVKGQIPFSGSTFFEYSQHYTILGRIC